MPIISIPQVPAEIYRPEIHEKLYIFDKPLQEKTKMPIVKLNVNESLPERSTRGIQIPEVREVLDALKNKISVPFKVTLTTESLTALSGTKDKPRNPYKVLSLALKRAFKNGGLSYSAYHSDSGKCAVVTKETVKNK